MNASMDKLRGKIVECGMTHEKLATLLGIDASTLSRKMKSNGLTFTVGQMHQIVDILNLTADEAKQIFLRQNSQ